MINFLKECTLPSLYFFKPNPVVVLLFLNAMKVLFEANWDSMGKKSMQVEKSNCLCKEVDSATFDDFLSNSSPKFITTNVNGSTSFRAIPVAAIVEAAISLMKAYKEGQEVAVRQNEVLSAINKAKEEIISKIFSVRLNELEAQVQALMNDYVIVPFSGVNFLEDFISNSNSAESAIRTFNVINNLHVADTLAPAYIMAVSLRAVACTVRYGNPINTYTDQVLSSLQELRQNLEGTVSCRHTSEPGTLTARYWDCVSTYTHIRYYPSDFKEDGVRHVLGTTRGC